MISWSLTEFLSPANLLVLFLAVVYHGHKMIRSQPWERPRGEGRKNTSRRGQALWHESGVKHGVGAVTSGLLMLSFVMGIFQVSRRGG